MSREAALLQSHRRGDDDAAPAKAAAAAADVHRGAAAAENVDGEADAPAAAADGDDSNSDSDVEDAKAAAEHDAADPVHPQRLRRLARGRALPGDDDARVDALTCLQLRRILAFCNDSAARMRSNAPQLLQRLLAALLVKDAPRPSARTALIQWANRAATGPDDSAARYQPRAAAAAGAAAAAAPADAPSDDDQRLARLALIGADVDTAAAAARAGRDRADVKSALQPALASNGAVVWLYHRALQTTGGTTQLQAARSLRLLCPAAPWSQRSDEQVANRVRLVAEQLRRKRGQPLVALSEAVFKVEIVAPGAAAAAAAAAAADEEATRMALLLSAAEHDAQLAQQQADDLAAQNARLQHELQASDTARALREIARRQRELDEREQAAAAADAAAGSRRTAQRRAADHREHAERLAAENVGVKQRLRAALDAVLQLEAAADESAESRDALQKQIEELHQRLNVLLKENTELKSQLDAFMQRGENRGRQCTHLLSLPPANAAR